MIQVNRFFQRAFVFAVIALGSVVLSTTTLAASLEPSWGFEGQYLISVSDADMVASAYVDGQLGPKEGSDQLSIIDVSLKPREYRAVEVEASNSVAGPPAALSVDAAGRYAYVIETFTPRPTDHKPHAFSDLKPGQLLTVYDLSDKQKPQKLAPQLIGSRPESVDVSPDGRWLLVSYYPDQDSADKPLALYRVDEGLIQEQYFPDLPQWNPKHRLISASWSPDGKHVALVNTSQAEVSFFVFDPHAAALKPWGNAVSVGKAPFIGRFSQDGQHFLVNNLFWGPDVEGTWNEAPNGTIANIKLNANGDLSQPRHALSSQVMTGPSPEGFTLSPDGEYVVALNMERSWLRYDDPRQSWFSSISLIKRDAMSGAMSVIHTLPYDGILPESAVFDNSGEYVAVTTFDHYAPDIPGGSIDFFRLVSDPLNKDRKMIMKTQTSVPVARGPHTLHLIRK